MDRVLTDFQPGLGTTGIVGDLTITKTGTTARTATFPDASITVARSDAAQTFTGQSTFTDGILTTHADAATSAGVHIGNLTHQDVAIFGAGGGQGSTFYGQINGTSLALSGAASCTSLTAIGSVTVDPAEFDRPSGVVIRRRYDTDAWHNLNLFAGWANFDYHYTGLDDGNWRWNYAQDGTTFTTLMELTKAKLTVNTGASFAGTAPGTPSAGQVLIGGGEVKAAGAGYFGGSVTCASLTVASADYIYLRGNATTDGSVRMSSPSAGVMTTESRISGTWTEIGRFG